jgi:hypothetical protein
VPIALNDELLRDTFGAVSTEARTNQGQHEMQWGNTAGAGNAVTIDAVEIVQEIDVRKFLANGSEILPVNGTAITG